MEKIASDLNVSESKQSTLATAYEALHSQASSILVFTLQWKDLQEHFDSTHNAIRTLFQELQEREKQLQALESNLKLEMESRKEDLFGVEKLIDEKAKEVIEIQRSIQKHNEEKERECSVMERRIQERTRKLNWVERRIEEKSNEVELKKKELNKYIVDCKLKVEELSVIDEAIVEREKNIEGCERRMRLKEEKLSWIDNDIEEKSKLVVSKEEEMNVIQRSVNVYRESIKSKESELVAVIDSIGGKQKEFDVKEEQIRTLQRLIEGCEKELKLKEEKLKECSLRNRHLEEWSCKLEFKEREVELKEKHVQSKMEEFKKWVEEKGKDLNALSSKLKAKELQVEQEAKELELTKKQSGVVPSSASYQSAIQFTDGKSMQLFVYEHMKRNDSMSNKITSFLQQESSEPAKLVLDAMQGFYPASNLSVENKEFDLVIIRRTCILLLEELKRLSPQINPELRGEAMKLASDWKAKMKVGRENWLEVLGFLRLVTTFEITSAYDGKGLLSLLDIVSQHEQATELSEALGTIDKAPSNSNICCPVKIEKPESPPAENEATSSSPNLQNAATAIDAGHLQWLQNKQFHEACDSALKGIIDDLIKNPKLIEAVGLIHTLKLSDKFPPVQILKEYVDKGKKQWRNGTRRRKLLEEKDKITDQHLEDLRAVIQCIKDYNLESECLLREIESQITVLEVYKKQIRLASSSLVLKVQQQQQQQQKVLKNVEVPKQQERKASSIVQQEEEIRTSNNAELQVKLGNKASSTVEEEQQQQTEQKVKQQEQEEQRKGKKRPSITLASRVDHQQQCKDKIQRNIYILADKLCESYPGCRNPSPST